MRHVLQSILLSFLLLPLATRCQALEVELVSPLVTVTSIAGEVPGGDKTVRARVIVPDDAPADLGVGAFVTDHHGRWYQRLAAGTLAHGSQMVAIRLGAADSVQGEEHGGGWNSAESAKSARAGLFFWSASASRARLRVMDLRADAAGTPEKPGERLLELEVGGFANGVATVATGERWTVSVLPQPFPANPYDRDEFSLDAVITLPDGHENRIPGFAIQPMRGADRGDRETVSPAGPARFAIRFRPRQPGAYAVRLEARWGAKESGGKTMAVAMQLPRLVARGKSWDAYVRVDHDDPRFFALGPGGSLVGANGEGPASGSSWWWPIGPNLRSVWDLRSQQYLGTVVTPDRGSLSYHAYFDRLAANGVDAVEIWMCSWNLALEWRGDWPGFFGKGRYNEVNAWRIDRVLDDAWAHGIRVNLVIYNHGQASDRTDKEWDNNPYSVERGGKLRDPSQFFTDPEALAAQERLRTYMVARWADHPAVMAWKLWSEINLTGAAQSEDTLRQWHEHATARWHELDTYGHPCTTHWAGDFRSPHRSIVALPGLDFVCIDAYHAPEGAGGGTLLAELLGMSTGSGEARRGGGLSRYGKPVLVTEYGGSWDACSGRQMEAEHASGGWSALVTGHAGAPMLWWFEWVDQGNRFAPYRALSRFLAGEDNRVPAGSSVQLSATDPPRELWARAWARPGRMLGYVLDRRWGASGEGDDPHEGAQVSPSSPIAAGRLLLEWWNADTGVRIQAREISHPGGLLALDPPRFVHHIAFKLIRVKDG